MKINKLIDSLNKLSDLHIEYDEKEIMRSVFNYINTLIDEGSDRFNSIFYINNGVVKSFCTGENKCRLNIIIIDNKAYFWENYEIKDDSIILGVYWWRIYTINDFIIRLLDTLRETPIENVQCDDYYVKLYDKLRQGYKIKIVMF